MSVEGIDLHIVTEVLPLGEGDKDLSPSTELPELAVTSRIRIFGTPGMGPGEAVGPKALLAEFTIPTMLAAKIGEALVDHERYIGEQYEEFEQEEGLQPANDKPL